MTGGSSSPTNKSMGLLFASSGKQQQVLKVFEWSHADSAHFVEHEVEWRAFVDFVVSNGKRAEAGSTELPVLAARDVRKLDPAQQHSHSKPLLAMRRGCLLVVIPPLAIFAVVQQGTLFLLCSTARQMRDEARETLQDIALWQRSHQAADGDVSFEYLV
eukprot:4176843-Prymnesium_polylepis.1